MLRSMPKRCLSRALIPNDASANGKSPAIAKCRSDRLRGDLPRSGDCHFRRRLCLSRTAICGQASPGGIAGTDVASAVLAGFASDGITQPIERIGTGRRG